ncbi:MAG TPA: xanthine dehydrogenase family protein [Magnetospirillaceae bacterium]|nr:xanthine dehydrogenase family protein [Magnetospirillaceae bacterium]
MPRLLNDPRKTDSPLSDLREEGMLHVITVRAPIRRGRILGIEIPHLPWGCRAIQEDDIPGSNVLPVIGPGLPVLSGHRVSYYGEPVLLLAGPDPSILADIRNTVRLSVEEEPPLLEWETFQADQAVLSREAELGDPDGAFSGAEQVLEVQFRTDSQEHLYPEPQGAFATFDYDKLVIRCATQWPFHVRDCVRSAIGVKLEDVVVRPTPAGPHMDGRIWYPSVLACHAALAAYLCRKPARILLERGEDFRYTPKKSRSLVSLRAALDASGNLTALDARIVMDTGAGAPLATELVEQACLHACGSLAIPNQRVKGYAVRTNAVPLDAFSGMGAAHSHYAAECLANRIAQERGEDPIEWRLRNILRKGSLTLTGEVFRERTSFEEIARRLKTSSDFARKHAGYEQVRKRRTSFRGEETPRGIGIAFCHQSNGPSFTSIIPGSYAVTSTLRKDLCLEISTSAVAGNEWVLSAWRSTAASILGIPEDKVRLSEASTASVTYSGPSVISRNVAVIGRLIVRSCTAIRSRRFRSPLPISTKATYHARNPVHWNAGRATGSPFEFLSYGAAVVEAELDLWRMEPRILAVWMCLDAGRVASEQYARSSLAASVMAALGQCFREHLPLEDGIVPATGYREYGVLSLAEAPPIEVEFLPWEAGDIPRGIEEMPFLCIPAAFAAAVTQASDLAVDSLPFDSLEFASGMDGL